MIIFLKSLSNCAYDEDLFGRLREDTTEDTTEERDPRKSKLAEAFAMLIKFFISWVLSSLSISLLYSTVNPNPAAAPVANKNKINCI